MELDLFRLQAGTVLPCGFGIDDPVEESCPQLHPIRWEQALREVLGPQAHGNVGARVHLYTCGLRDGRRDRQVVVQYEGCVPVRVLQGEEENEPLRSYLLTF